MFRVVASLMTPLDSPSPCRQRTARCTVPHGLAVSRCRTALFLGVYVLRRAASRSLFTRALDTSPRSYDSRSRYVPIEPWFLHGSAMPCLVRGFLFLTRSLYPSFVTQDLSARPLSDGTGDIPDASLRGTGDDVDNSGSMSHDRFDRLSGPISLAIHAAVHDHRATCGIDLASVASL